MIFQSVSSYPRIGYFELGAVGYFEIGARACRTPVCTPISKGDWCAAQASSVDL
jgi:hypothetical protein